MSKTLHTPIS